MSVVEALIGAGTYILPFLFVLTVVVFVHELGHFLVGRWCGIQVDAFSLGFGHELFAFVDRKGTRWRVAALPLGGYVKFHGDATAAGGTDEIAVRRMPESERAISFFAQPVWKRALVVAAGPIANFILAVVVFAGVFFFYGRAVLLPRVDTVVIGGAADAAGFQKGDLILQIDGGAIDSFTELQRIVTASAGETLRVLIDRDGSTLTLTATPRLSEISTPLGKSRAGILGINAGSHPQDWRIEHYGIVDATRLATAETWFVISRTAGYIGGLLSGRESADQLSGPAGLAQASGEMAKIGFSAVLNLIAVLSISIGLLNLMPIPLLDGGHLVFYFIEAVRGRALGQRAQEFGFRIGLAVVGGLMIFATYNDLARLVPMALRFIGVRS
jgi:regulator of sigma E protease